MGVNLAHGPYILTINGGSSSIKFALFSRDDPPVAALRGEVQRIGSKQSSMTLRRANAAQPENRPLPAATHEQAGQFIAQFIASEFGLDAVGAIGHRVVHGGLHLLEHQPITPALLQELRAAQPLDPNHLPDEIALIQTLGQCFPAAVQIACFDTAFHRDMPRISQLLPIPRHYLDAGVRRFGFHGLSYEYLLGQLKTLDPPAAAGRVILAHLGAGASLAAVRDGKPVDTTMALTPTAGLVMATRPGDIDPGLLVYLMRQEHLSADDLDRFITRQCGLIALSQTTTDMRDLLARRDTDPRAAEAIALFCHQARKHIAAMAASLGGVETLVFSGGIGQHAAPVRAAICDALEFLGIRIDPAANNASGDIISMQSGSVIVRIIPTDEESVMARIVNTHKDLL